MAKFFSIGSHLVFPPFHDPTRLQGSFIDYAACGILQQKLICRGGLCVARLGFENLPFVDFSGLDIVKGVFSRAENVTYTVADAAVSALDTGGATETSKQSGDWLSGITNHMESVLKVLKGGLSAVHVPYAYGFAIILLTVLVKAATFPLTKKQVESATAMRSLRPQIKAIQQQYAGDQERIRLETAKLYKLAGINPLAGFLPTLATVPVWIGLYRALSNVANEGLLTEGFFWIPSLAGPTTLAARQNGNGISWLFPFVDGHPPLGWLDTSAYLVLPALLVVSQYISMQISQSSQSNDPSLKSSQALTKFLPLMTGYFSLSLPSGLSLYWFTNNILNTAQQAWLQKLGGAKNSVPLFTDDIFKEEKLHNQKSENFIKKVATQGKKTPEGLHPGERFKMIKEQEAKRRCQREEEKRKAEIAAAGRAQLTNKEEDNKEVSLDAGAGTELVAGIVNRNLSSQDVKENQKRESAFTVENAELPTYSSIAEKGGQQSHKNTKKDAVQVRG